MYTKLLLISLVISLSQAERSRVGCVLNKKEIFCNQATYSEVQYITKTLYNEPYTKLTINNSYIAKIDSAILHKNCHSRLEQVDILNTPVTSITSIAFANLKNLGKVLIENTNLKSIKSKTFSELPLLKNIRIINNLKLTSISKKAFNLLPKLEQVLIENNPKLKEIAQWFSSVPNMKILSVQNCAIKSITKSALNDLPNLIDLLLNDNSLTSILTKRFDALTKLKNLDLPANKISKISDNAFGQLNNLKTLNLEGNALNKLSNQAFSGLNNLVNLTLNKNSIKALNYNSFKLSSLRTLLLEENYLTELSVESLIENAPKLKTLNIHKNLFICDDLKPILEKLDELKIDYLGSETLLQPRIVDTINGVVCYVS